MADSKVKVKEEDVELEDMEDDEEGSGDAGTPKRPLPGSLTAFQNHLEMMQTLPTAVKRRLKALKRLQFESTKIEAKFYEEYHALEVKYQTSYQPLRDKRKVVVTGEYEPTDDEALWPSDDEKEEDLCSEAKSKMKIEEVASADSKSPSTEEKNKKNENAKGIPDFWLVIFKNVGILAEMVQEHDEPILSHLRDITVQLTNDPMGFILQFHFSPNEYFTNTILTKEYEMKCEPDENDPFSFEGPEIIKCKGCTIDWKKGKNVTVKVVKKKQKHRARGSIRTVTRTVQNDSFFNFFSPPPVPEEPDADMDEHIQSLLTADFEIGHYIRERIVPNAVLFFTGEALEDEEYEEEEEEEEEGEEGEGENEVALNSRGGHRGAGAGGNPAECKQQ